MGKLTRRALLGTAAVGAFGLVAYGGGRVACSFVPRNHPDFFSLLDIPADDAVSRRIGRGALAEVGLPSDFDGFASAMQLRPLIAEAVATDCPTTRRRLVQDQCAQDFAEGRCVVIDGWVLSETEASLCAAKLLRPSVI